MREWTTLLIGRGWNPTEYVMAVDRGDEDSVTIHHPFNFASEREVEDLGEDILADLVADGFHKPLPRLTPRPPSL